MVQQTTEALGTLLSDELLDSLVDLVSQLMRVTRCSLMLLDSQAQMLRLAAAVGLPRDASVIEVPVGDRVAGVVAQRREPLFVRGGAQTLTAAPPGRYRSDTLISVPIEAADELLGVLSVTDRTDDAPFDTQDLALLRTLAAHAGACLRALRRSEATRSLSETDELTGLWNYRHFQRRIVEEWAKASRGDLPFALLMIDLNRFKAVNDTYGHPFGNRVLQLVAQRLLLTMRTGDVLARYGGDEFAAILPGAQGRAAVALARRLARKVAQPLRVATGAVAAQVQLSLSIGIALFPETAPTAEALIDLADQAVYHAKQHPASVICLITRAPDGAVAIHYH